LPHQRPRRQTRTHGADPANRQFHYTLAGGCLWRHESRPPRRDNIRCNRAPPPRGRPPAIMPDYQIFEAGDVVLQSGLTYRRARLAYKTFGALDAAKSNVIAYPTSYRA